jgi:hypothetical protein
MRRGKAGSGRAKGPQRGPFEGGAAAPPEGQQGSQPPRRIMSKKSRLVLLAFILSSMNSIASISSIG